MRQIIEKPHLPRFEKCIKDLIFTSFSNLEPRPQFADNWQAPSLPPLPPIVDAPRQVPNLMFALRFWLFMLKQPLFDAVLCSFGVVPPATVRLDNPVARDD